MAASQNPLSPPTLLDRFFIYGAGGGSTLSICSSLAACAGTAHIGPAICSYCPPWRKPVVPATRPAGPISNSVHTPSECCATPC